ncbi:MAG: hypothetical protein N0E54_19145 [Candidatus Thiodiazotropha taylori]|nr:hypothetical protein [Candidatus Thiodiazotropha endolucinida]MCW4230865.1 hypothetical protein [Candidatus Thiodiazotropha taylori]
MKNFVIALEEGSPKVRDEITNYFSKENWAYWHWIDDFWIVQVSDEYSSKQLHEELEANTEIVKPTLLILSLDGNNQYWGRNEDDAWSWLNHIGRAE